MALKINGTLVAGLGTNGAGVPAGGTSNQILQKQSNVDFDTAWIDAPQVPTKTSEIENDSDFATNASVDTKIQSHRNNTEIHITAEERELWNGANTYTDNAIAALVGSAPETLNTLEEISRALNEDAEYVINLASKVDTKQDALTGELNQVVSFDAEGKVVYKTLIASDVGAVDAEYVAGEISAVEAEIDTKQDSLTGTNGQVVGFDENGNATAIDLNLSNTQSAFIIHVSELVQDEGSSYIPSESFEDAYNAITNNIPVFLEINNSGFLIHYPCTSYTEDESLDFSLVNNWYGELTLETFTWSIETSNRIYGNDPRAIAEVSSIENYYLPLSGGSMEGSLILAQDPTEDLEAATKQYVDNLIGDINSILQSI